MGIAVGDYNRDGQVDLYVTSFSDDYNTLYRNEGDGNLSDVRTRAGLGDVSLPFLAWGTGFVDVDNDGLLDILVVNGHVFRNVEQQDWGSTWAERPQLFRNLDGVRFLEVPPATGSGLAVVIPGRGAAFGDLFNDGRIDVVINNIDATPTVLRNAVKGTSHWLALRLEGRGTSPRDAIGAKVFLTAGGVRQRADVTSGGSYASSSDLRVFTPTSRPTRGPSSTIRARTATPRSRAFARPGKPGPVRCGLPPSAPVHRPALRQPQRRRTVPSGRTATCTSPWATAAPAATRTTTARTWTRCWARSCGSTSTARRRRDVRHPARNPFADARRHADEIWLTPACATPGASLRPRRRATCGSATSARAPGRRSTSRGRGAGGLNFGWNRMEGAHCFRRTRAARQAGLTLPVTEYGHDLGCTVIGGYVYRGAACPALGGRVPLRRLLQRPDLRHRRRDELAHRADTGRRLRRQRRRVRRGRERRAVRHDARGNDLSGDGDGAVARRSVRRRDQALSGSTFSGSMPSCSIAFAAASGVIRRPWRARRAPRRRCSARRSRSRPAAPRACRCGRTRRCRA